MIKPNASSASWGVQDARDWAGVEAAVASIHAEGHDAIVEPFLNGSDVEVPVITVDGEPVVMPMMLFEQADPTHLRTYYEKRDLVERGHKYQLVDFDDGEWVPKIAAMTRDIAEEFRPFDYGRFEFRLDAETGTLQLPRGQSAGQSLVGEGVRPLGEARRAQPVAADRDHPLRGPAPPRFAR